MSHLSRFMSGVPALVVPCFQYLYRQNDCIRCGANEKRGDSPSRLSRDELRKKCRRGNQQLLVQWTGVDGSKVSLDRQDLLHVFRKESNRTAALQRLAQLTTWDSSHVHRAHAFWHSDLGAQLSVDDVPPSGALRREGTIGLWSAATKAGLTINLWTYHGIIVDTPHVAAGRLVLRPAEEILPWKEFCLLRSRGLHRAHLADLVRFRACLREGGWWIDDDILWFRQPQENMITKDGHAIATCARRCIQGRKTDEDFKYWQLNYLRVPGERSSVTSPFLFPAGSRLACIICGWLDEVCFAKSPPAELVKDYNFVMKKIPDFVEDCGLASCYLPTNAFCSVPYFCPSACLGQRSQFVADRPFHGASLPAKETIVANSIGQTNFWASTQAQDFMNPRSIDCKKLHKAPVASLKSQRIGLMDFDSGSLADAIFQHLQVPREVAVFKIPPRRSIKQILITPGQLSTRTAVEVSSGSTAGPAPPSEYLDKMGWFLRCMFDWACHGEGFLAAVAVCKASLHSAPGGASGAKLHLQVEKCFLQVVSRWRREGLGSTECLRVLAFGQGMWRSGAPWVPGKIQGGTLCLDLHDCSVALALVAWKFQRDGASRDIPLRSLEGDARRKRIISHYELVIGGK